MLARERSTDVPIRGSIGPRIVERSNATGSIDYVVEQHFVTGAYEITAVGSIDY